MQAKVEIRMDAKSMADFMVYHIYSGMAGITALLLGVLNIGLTVSFAVKREFLLMAVFLAFAFLILFGLPAFIRNKVGKQMQNSRLADPVTYEFDDEGVTTTTESDSGVASWSMFKRAVSRKGIIILYDPQKRAIILPVEQLGEAYTDIVDMIYAHMPAPAVRIRRLDGK